MEGFPKQSSPPPYNQHITRWTFLMPFWALLVILQEAPDHRDAEGRERLHSGSVRTRSASPYHREVEGQSVPTRALAISFPLPEERGSVCNILKGPPLEILPGVPLFPSRLGERLCPFGNSPLLSSGLRRTFQNRLIWTRGAPPTPLPRVSPNLGGGELLTGSGGK